MAETILLRYGELALKSPPVRREFEGRLSQNILSAFLSAGIECTVTSDHGHLYIHTETASTAIPVARRIFGLVSVSPVSVLPTDLTVLSAHVVSLAGDLREGTRFAVRARRTGSHRFTSHDVDVKIGEAILTALPEKGFKVDLTNPEREFHVEIRGPTTYVYTEKYSAPGGIPLGVAGRVGAHVNGLRGALGAWLMMKRGCRVFLVASGRYASLVDVLIRFDPEMGAVDMVEEDHAWEVLRQLVAERDLSGLSLPLLVEDYSQARTYWGETVIFSPTVGMSEEEVEQHWRKVKDLAE